MAMHFNILCFTQIDMYARQALAISKDGSLYVWGTNEDAMLGLENMKEILWVPTQNDYFKKFKVTNIACGMSHSLVLVNQKSKSGKPILNKTQLYALGKPMVPSEFTYLGITEG